MNPPPEDLDSPATISPAIEAVIVRALRDMEHLPSRDRITLLRGVAEICPAGSERHEVALHLAHLLTRAEAEQLEFRRLFPS